MIMSSVNDIRSTFLNYFARNGHEIDELWQKKKDLLHRIEELT